MKHLMRPFRNTHYTGSLALALTALCLAGGSHPLHAQGSNVTDFFANPFPLLSHSTQGYLGVDIADVDQEKAQQLKLKDVKGAVITLIDHDAPAGKIGLKVNDVVLALNGQAVEGAEQLRRMLREIPAGHKVSIEISRDGNIQTLAAELADRVAMERDIWGQIDKGGDVASPAPTLGILSGGGGDLPSNPGFHVPFFGSSLNVGAVIEPLTSQMDEVLGVNGGVMVKQVTRKSEAAKSGLRAFDVILKVGTDPINTSADWERALRSNEGKPVQVTILRDKKQQTLTLQVDSKRHAGLDWMDLFGDGDAVQLAENDELVPETLAAQAEAARAKANIDAAQIEEQAQKQAGQVRKQLEGQADKLSKQAQSLSDKQAEKLRKQAEQMAQQAEQFGKDFSGGKFGSGQFKVDPEQMKKLQEQMDRFKEDFNSGEFMIDPKQMEQFQQQIENMKKSFNAEQFKVDPQQMKQLQEQMDQFKQNFNPDQFKVDPKQMEELKRQMEQWKEQFQDQMEYLREQQSGHFV